MLLFRTVLLTFLVSLYLGDSLICEVDRLYVNIEKNGKHFT